MTPPRAASAPAPPTLAGLAIDEVALRASICLDSFYAFTQELWHVVVPETPVWNWHIEYLCDEFQADAERVFAGEPKLHDTVCNVPPGSTKSTILSIFAPAWVLARRPDMRILAACHTETLTHELGRKCKMVLDCPEYQAMFPNTRPSKDQWAKSLFITDRGGGRFAATVGGKSPTGFHAHFILVDDPLDPAKAKKISGKEIETANNFMSEVIPSRKVNSDITVTWLIMQRLHQNDPSGFLLSKGTDGLRHICLPAERSNRIRPKHLITKYKGGLMDPVRLSKKILEKKKTELGEFAYAGQYRQNPVPRGGGMFKVARIEIATPPPMDDNGWVGLCRGWDKAGTKDGGCYTVGLLMGRYRRRGAPKDGAEDTWWILGVERVQFDSGAREELIKAVTKRDGKKVEVGIEQEPGSGGKESAEATVKRLAGYRARVVPAVGDKEERADEWSRQVNVGAFKMAKDNTVEGDPKDTSWNYVFLEEARFFPYSTYKDQIDAGSIAFTVLAKGRRRVGAV